MVCGDCGHSIDANPHGFDQNDFVWSHEANDYVHRGACTYCRECNPEIFKQKETKNDSDTASITK